MDKSTKTDAPPPIAAQTGYWNRRWRKQRLPNGWQQKRAEAVYELARELPLKYPQILDLGCGTGFMTDMLAKLGAAHGIDLSPAAIAIAKATYPGAEFRAGDLFEMELAAEPMDLVVCLEVIPHVIDQAGLVRKIADTLKPDGYLIITAANKFVMSRLTGEDGGPIGSGPLDPKEHIKQWLSMRELKALLRPHFRIQKTTSVMPLGQRGILRLINSYKVNQVVGSVLSPERLEALKGRMGWGYTIVVVGQKRA